MEKKIISLFERDSQWIKASGKLDGVKTFFIITTLQKNFCIYDYMIISKSIKKLNIDEPYFNEVIKGIIPE